MKTRQEHRKTLNRTTIEIETALRNRAVFVTPLIADGVIGRGAIVLQIRTLPKDGATVFCSLASSTFDE